jgi:hypothetical protein
MLRKRALDDSMRLGSASCKYQTAADLRACHATYGHDGTGNCNKGEYLGVVNSMSGVGTKGGVARDSKLFKPGLPVRCLHACNCWRVWKASCDTFQTCWRTRLSNPAKNSSWPCGAFFKSHWMLNAKSIPLAADQSERGKAAIRRLVSFMNSNMLLLMLAA